jgi:hypothetical protein
MPTTIYDSSLLTQRRRAKAESGSFITRISPWNVVNAVPATNGTPQTYVQTATNQPTTGYAPSLGIYDQSIINQVRNGNMTFYRKGSQGVVTVNNGCPCIPLSNSTICGTN